MCGSTKAALILLSKPQIKTAFFFHSSYRRLLWKKKELLENRKVKSIRIKPDVKTWQKFSSQHSSFWCMLVFFLHFIPMPVCLLFSEYIQKWRRAVRNNYWNKMRAETTWTGWYAGKVVWKREGKKPFSEGAKYRGWERVLQKGEKLWKLSLHKANLELIKDRFLYCSPLRLLVDLLRTSVS